MGRREAREIVEVKPCGPKVGDGDEYYEQDVAGGRLKLLATRWKNTSGQAVTMEFLIDGVRTNAAYRPALAGVPGNPQYLPPTFMRVVVPVGQEVLVPQIYDAAVQQTRCSVCLLQPLAVCLDETHPKEIVGGEGMRLERISPQISPTPPKVSRSLDPALPSVAPQSIDERLWARVGVRGVS